MLYRSVEILAQQMMLFRNCQSGSCWSRTQQAINPICLDSHWSIINVEGRGTGRILGKGLVNVGVSGQTGRYMPSSSPSVPR